jgi:hypothetical protein
MSIRIGHRGDRWIELGAWHAVVGDALRFCDAAGALLFLRQRIQPEDLRRLRALLTDRDVVLQRLDEAVLLQLVSQRLHAGTLKAVAWYDRIYSFTEPVAAWQPPRIELPAPAPRESAPFRESSELSRVAPAPAPLMPGDVDAQAQASALREAASDGTPFCEICQRTPPEPLTSPTGTMTESLSEPTLPRDSDAAAQARVLREAAEEGTPLLRDLPALPQRVAVNPGAPSPGLQTPRAAPAGPLRFRRLEVSG